MLEEILNVWSEVKDSPTMRAARDEIARRYLGERASAAKRRAELEREIEAGGAPFRKAVEAARAELAKAEAARVQAAEALRQAERKSSDYHWPRERERQELEAELRAKAPRELRQLQIEVDLVIDFFSVTGRNVPFVDRIETGRVRLDTPNLAHVYDIESNRAEIEARANRLLALRRRAVEAELLSDPGVEILAIREELVDLVQAAGADFRQISENHSNLVRLGPTPGH